MQQLSSTYDVIRLIPLHGVENIIDEADVVQNAVKKRSLYTINKNF